VKLRPDNTALVSFDADKDVVLTTGSRAAVRYLNLVGDRYLELLDGPGSARVMPRGSQIPLDRTQPALDLDLLLGGLKPVIRGLDPKDVNALTGALLEIFQGQGDTIQSLLNRTSSFSNTLADNNAALEQLTDNLNTVLATLGSEGERFSGALDRFEKLTTALSADRDPIGSAIESLSSGTASIAELLTNVRPPLAGTVDQLNRLAPLVDQDKGLIDAAIQRAPQNYRKLVRVGSYGSFVNYYLCGISLRVTDLQGRTAVFPWVKQRDGRCAEP
jgi:phospholipid/cholesterol/gamma-HCH transport system substrate-binding protein